MTLGSATLSARSLYSSPSSLKQLTRAPLYRQTSGIPSAAKTGNPNLQVLYAAFRGDGVYIANPAYISASMVLMSGSPGGTGRFTGGG